MSPSQKSPLPCFPLSPPITSKLIILATFTPFEFFFSLPCLLYLRILQFWKCYRTVEGKLKVSTLAGVGCFLPAAPSHPLPRFTWGNGRQAAARHPQTQQHLLPPLHTLSAGGQGQLSSSCNPPPPADFPKEERSGVLWGDSKWPEQSGKSGHLHCSPFPCLQWSVTL